MSTQSQAAAAVQAATAKLKANDVTIAALQAQVATLTADKTATASALAKAQSDLAACVASKNALLAQIADLQTQLSNQTALSAELESALADLNAELGGGGTTTTPPPPPPPPPPTGDDAAIEAELTDSTIAGIDKRLGPKGDPAVVFPEVWTRPQVPTKDFGWNGGASEMGTYSQSLAVQASAVAAGQPLPDFDFGADELGFGYVDDVPFVVNPTNPAAVNSDGGPGPQGVGLGRLRLEEHTQGMVKAIPCIPWNDPQTIPDERAASGHTASFGMGNKLGRYIKAVRGRINRYDGGFALCDKARGGQAYIATIPTNTAWSPWAGEQLDNNFIPLSLAVSSQNEFLFVGGHDKSTGTGKLVVIVNWGGQDVEGKRFPFDLTQPMPGLLQSGVITGMKIIGTVDLPVKWPTSISIATSRNSGSDRIEGLDGNAAYLSSWDLSTKTNRDAFLTKNGGWISNWGKLVVAGKYENKVVQLDATSLFQGYRDQYFTTQANYDLTRPQNPGNAWYAIYNTTDQTVWPNMPAAWVPTVTRVLDIPRPTVAWMLETNDGAFVVADESGMLRWFKDNGTPDGTLQLGANITSIKDDKYAGVRNGALTVVSRVARTVYGVAGKAIKWTIQDSQLVDPVDAGTTDTHGIEDRGIWILDFDGKQIRMYRNTKLVFTTQGGAVFGTGPTAEADKLAADAAVAAWNTPNPPVENLEFTGAFALSGYPHTGADSNVN